MSASDPKPGNPVQEVALLLAARLRTHGGSKGLRRRARGLLKEAYELEQECGAEKKLDSSQEERARTLADDMDQHLGALTCEDAERLVDSLLARFNTPEIDIGRSIQPERMAMVAMQADQLSARFLSRIGWFWERSERARTGVAGIGGSQEDPSPEKKPAERERFELIWRRRRK